ncbi:MAG TPA: potassium channel family protein [Candidatus Aquilonibacter sp.]|nr:potassium channel family protein [Candidatus Aquilonibacter sp.]
MQIQWLRSRFFSRYRIEILMGALIVEMLASPLADTHPRAGALLGFTVLLMLLAGLRYMANRAIVRQLGLPIAAIWMITRILEAFGNRREFYANLSPIVGLVLSCSILWAIFDHFRSESRNSRKPIVEAFISYLVIATAFSQLYWILNRFVDHAFNQTIRPTESGTFLYFSIVTLTSVGYGGIAPINPYVRMVAAFESVCGIFFIAVVVARLVSSYAPTRSPEANSRGRTFAATSQDRRTYLGKTQPVRLHA